MKEKKDMNYAFIMLRGKKVMSKDFTGNYKNAKISGNQVILYDGKKMQDILKKWCGKISR
ncbi:MAG: DUF5711 family protein [Lachnospiraceae bacterium]